MEGRIYHYKNGHKFDPVVIPIDQERDWQELCRRIAKEYPHDPYPYWEDVVAFQKQQQNKTQDGQPNKTN